MKGNSKVQSLIPSWKTALLVAVTSRVVILTLGIVSNAIVPDYDLSTAISLRCDGLLCGALSSFVRWDAVYFVEIAENGYLYEQNMAFFPLYPWIVRLLATTGAYLNEMVHRNLS
jgi:phosphatidylinositol glycan class V